MPAKVEVLCFYYQKKIENYSQYEIRKFISEKEKAGVFRIHLKFTFVDRLLSFTN